MKRTFKDFPQTGKMRRRAHWALMLSTTLAASATAGVQSAAASSDRPDNQGGPQAGSAAAKDARVLQFNIPAGPLDTAIAEYRRVTGLLVILTKPAIGSVQSPGVSGSMTAERAMEAMLAGTSVRATFAPDAVSLDIKGVTETVAVEGKATKLSSPKYTQPLLDTPQTVVVIPQQVYQEQNATSLREVLRNTPGITMSIGEGGSGGTSSGDNVLIRGFSARNDIYVDGIRDVGLVNRDAFNTEMVEVAKGPTSVTGGRGTTGGSINLVTKAPGLQDAASVRLTGGTRGQRARVVRRESQVEQVGGVPSERHVAGHRLRGTRCRKLQELGRGAVVGDGSRHPDAVDAELLAPSAEQRPRLGHSDAAARHGDRQGHHRQRSQLQQLLRHRLPRLRDHQVRHRHRDGGPQVQPHAEPAQLAPLR